MPKNRFIKLKNSSFPISGLIDMGSPDLFYSVQQALQNEGILLVDLYTGDVIEGQVNIPNIGMIIGTKTAISKRQMGFIQGSSPKSTEFDKRDLDAVLIFDQTIQRVGDALSLIIQVVDFDDMALWGEISLRIARQFIYKEGTNRVNEIFFNITSLSRSNGIDASARNAALREVRGYSLEGTDSISNIGIPPDNEDFYEEGGDSEFKKRSRRK